MLHIESLWQLPGLYKCDYFPYILDLPNILRVGIIRQSLLTCLQLSPLKTRTKLKENNRKYNRVAISSRSYPWLHAKISILIVIHGYYLLFHYKNRLLHTVNMSFTDVQIQTVYCVVFFLLLFFCIFSLLFQIQAKCCLFIWWPFDRTTQVLCVLTCLMQWVLFNGFLHFPQWPEHIKRGG